mmetsp:Transcript_32276/g.47714  ORF Transcript_32276/g.47714 Transcript_32276/m.47714 type:complete len:110 (-) Transcript_32276:189-518(-)
MAQRTILSLLILLCFSVLLCLSSEVHESNQLPQGRADSVDENHRRLEDFNSQGPWPECQGMQFEACKTLIQNSAPDVYVVKNNPNEFKYHRIRIFVTEGGQVAKIPKRG